MTANSLRQLAKGVGRAHQVVARWIKHPAWDQSRTPPWDIEKARTWATRTLRPDRSKVWEGPEPVTVESGDLEALKKNPISLARLKLMIVRAEKLALEKAILSGDYLLKAEVQAGRVRRVHAAKGVLLGIPRILSRELVGLDATEIETRLEAAIREALLELSKGPPEDG